MSVSAIVPAYNEEDKIEKTLRSLRLIPEIKEIIVVDDGSEDRTFEVAQNNGVVVLQMEKNMGKSRAVYQGLLHSSHDLIALVDADLEESAVEMRKLIFPVMTDQADMTVAHFKERVSGGGFGLVKKIASYFLTKVTGHAVESPLSGQRVLRRCLLEDAGPFIRGFGLEFGLTAIGLQRGLRVMEIDTEMFHRLHGKSLKGFIHRGKQLIDIIKVLFIILTRKKEVLK